MFTEIIWSISIKPIKYFFSGCFFKPLTFINNPQDNFFILIFIKMFIEIISLLLTSSCFNDHFFFFFGSSSFISFFISSLYYTFLVLEHVTETMPMVVQQMAASHAKRVSRVNIKTEWRPLPASNVLLEDTLI